jgi:hypothetical protein
MPNYILLEKITVGAAGASSVTFSGIPQTGYTDLKVVYSARSNSSFFFDRSAITFNGVTSGYSWRELAADGTTPGSVAYSSQASLFNVTPSINGSTSTASTFGNAELYIPNYTSSNQKSVSFDWVMENNSASGFFVGFDAGLSNITSGITSITIAPTLGTLVQGSTFYLYGVAKLGTTPAIFPSATGGDTIMTDGTYWYHTFVSSGTFTPQKAITCDYLVVAGGGGGGTFGGGGAGGYRTGTAYSVSANASYTVTVGAGGAASASGSNSIFDTITSAGGGAGGDYSNTTFNGTAGGSGGGGGTKTGSGSPAYGQGSGGAGNTPSTSPSQGAGGGLGDGTGQGAGGGGGGGSSGTGGNFTGNFNNNDATGGAGGIATANSISGSSLNYAGGGGGGAGNVAGLGATGVGGNGKKASAPSTAATAGTTNRGGGGGGGYADAGAAGGSGVVIVRYAV